MRVRTMVLLGTTVFATMLAGVGVSSAECARRTAAGSCKDPKRGYQLSCGQNGKVTEVAGMRFHVNQSPSGAEIEACGDSGPGNQQGRLMLVVDRQRGARAILDSDPDQAFPAGYVLVQASPEKPGVWCSADTGPHAVGDGYTRSWSDPGPDGGLGPAAANCVPNPG